MPLQFKKGESAESLGITGTEIVTIHDIGSTIAKAAKELKVELASEDGKTKKITVDVRLDTPREVEYFDNGGILQYVLRNLLRSIVFRAQI